MWRLAARQHWVVALFQLVELGYTESAIHHRLAKGRLHRVRRGVYAVGRPQLTREGEWMAAVLTCGPEACLSHDDAAALWGIRSKRRGAIHVTLPVNLDRRHRGLVVHSRDLPAHDRMRQHGIPVTSPIRTLIDVACGHDSEEVESAINEADKLDLVDPEALRIALEERKGQRGVAILRRILDRRTFALTDSELERRFLSIVQRAGLPVPETQRWVNGFRVDFYWPALGLVVETDGLRYHRTPAQQARDRVRDQTHAAAGLTPLRFTHAQVRFEPRRVQATLAAVARRLTGTR